MRSTKKINMSEKTCLLDIYDRETRRGHVYREVRERYLRDDLGFGQLCHATHGSNPEEKGVGTRVDFGITLESKETFISVLKQGDLLVLDTNVVLAQMDVLEAKCDAFPNVVITETVMLETKHRNLSLYNRLLLLLRDNERRFIFLANEHYRGVYLSTEESQAAGDESKNDRNDRAIRRVAEWYGSNFQGNLNVVLLTNDRACLRLARSDGIESTTLHEYVKQVSDSFPELIDLLAPEADQGMEKEKGKGKGKGKGKKERVYARYKSDSVLKRDVKNGTLFEGTLRISMYRNDQATVLVHSKAKDGNGTRVRCK
jgi:exosome complex exonuclease DIS3/RRP44